MNKNNKLIIFFLILTGMAVINGCQKDFLDRVPEDTYVASEFYQTPEEIEIGVNPLYGGVWFDYYRNFIWIGDVMAGNYHKGYNNEYFTFAIAPSSNNLSSAYASLYMAVSYVNVIKENIENYSPESIPQSIKNKYLGEALVMKSMANFFLVRCFGDVPVIHNSTELINSGVNNVAVLNKVKMYDVYEYIIRSLKKAVELLPHPSESEIGRANRWSAYGLLSKAYLTRSGLSAEKGMNTSGMRNQSDLDSAAKYARLVVNNGPELHLDYSELFRISTGNRNAENLISWHWIVSDSWGTQNAMQADLAPSKFTGFWDGWGSFNSVTIDLVSKFGEDARIPGPTAPSATYNRPSPDARRKATVMLDGDFYPELHRDQGGFAVHWDANNPNTQIRGNCGSLPRKHLVGNNEDHMAESGTAQGPMRTSLSTHLLRVSDIYLVLAEALLGNDATTSNPEALAAINAVRTRAGAGEITEFDLDYIYDERRRELAFEGDNWFDFVRLAYYNPTKAMSMIENQERGNYTGGDAHNNSNITVESKSFTPANTESFILPFPASEILVNPNLSPDVEAIDMDWSSIEF